MRRLQIGIVRHASVANEIARALDIEHPPDCRIGRGRTTLTFRRLGASHWPEQQQIEHALRSAAVARAVFAASAGILIRRRATRAIVIRYEDSTILRGCAVEARWECVVPAAAQEEP